MAVLRKQLSDTDSECCASRSCSSNQTHFHLGQWNTAAREIVFRDLFRDDFVNGAAVRLFLSKANIIFNLFCHFYRQTECYKRIPKGAAPVRWNLDRDWLLANINRIDGLYAKEKIEFSAALSTEPNGLKRVALRAITTPINLQELFFAQDYITIVRRTSGDGYDVRVEHFDQNVANKVRSLFEESPVSNENAHGSDLVGVALRMFVKARKGKFLEQGHAVNARLREYFDRFSEQSLGALTEEQIKELFTGTHAPDGSLDLRTMWSVTGQTYGGTIDPKGDEQKIQKIRDYLVRLKHDAAIASTFWADNDPLRPAGFGSSVVTELLMKFHPDEVLMYAKEGCASLKQLGLIEFDAPNSNTAKRAAEFKIVQAAGTVILSKMHAMNIDKFIKADGTGDVTAADYLTVNEFLCFVKDQFKEIQNEVMKMSLETPTNATNAGNKEWKDVLSDNPDDMMNRLVSALLTKPFAILAGASGTGKSRMVRKLAYMTCLNTQLQPDPQTKKPIENFRMVQVKPNWHDSSDLLGYRSSVSGSHDYISTDFVRFILKAHAFPNTPFFVCLDEMNLAPVEHYFAEFLSASESARIEDGEYMTDPIIDPGEFYGNIANLDPQGYSIPQARKDLIEKRGLYIPKNLFVVGTVNMDDTTGGFSRKVLDRAMTIEMNEVNFDDLQKPVELRLMDKVENGQIVEKGLLLKAPQIEAFINRIAFKHENFDDPFKVQLEDIRGKLATTTLAFAYRFARECVQYRDALKLLFPNEDGNPPYDHGGFALDHMFLMKILPRLVGNAEDREPIVKTLETFFATLTGHGASAKKLSDMKKASESNGGFLSYYL